MKYITARGQASNIAWVFLPDTTKTNSDDPGKTGLTNASAGLTIAVRRELSPTMTVYSGANIGAIVTLGAWVAPAAGKCNFKEVDATNAPGLYELHFLDAVYDTSDASRKLLGIVRATGVVSQPFEISLTDVDLQDRAKLFQKVLAEAYAAKNAVPTPEQAIMGILQALTEMSISGTTMTIKKIDQATPAFTETLDSPTAPTSLTRAT